MLRAAWFLISERDNEEVMPDKQTLGLGIRGSGCVEGKPAARSVSRTAMQRCPSHE
jgi:hypothetical protein